MSTYRQSLPQLQGGFYLTDGGLETTLIFHQGIELPEFASFTLLKTADGVDILRSYFRLYADMAVRYNAGMILESVTWRANPDWGSKLGYSTQELADANRHAIEMLVSIRNEYSQSISPMVISGCIGPRGDGYRPDHRMTVDEARVYHQAQVDVLESTPADMISAFTMNYVEEALGIVQAAQRNSVPVVISFTVETDGRLATGQTLSSAIEQIDAATANYPSYYMINCAHPRHFENVLHPDVNWTRRIRGLRVNSSAKSHAELNESTELDIGHPSELGADHIALKRLVPSLCVLGGCCGTDHRHVDAIARACRPLFD